MLPGRTISSPALEIGFAVKIILKHIHMMIVVNKINCICISG